MNLDDVNRMDRDAFVAAFGSVFEHSSWVAVRAYDRRPFESLDALHQAMSNAVARASSEEQLALIRAHPDLGARARMSAASEGEQAGAGLDRLNAEEFERLHRLNTEYHEKFGFPFIYAVKGSGKLQILDALERRLTERPDAERATALTQIDRIAQFRLETILSCTTS